MDLVSVGTAIKDSWEVLAAAGAAAAAGWRYGVEPARRHLAAARGAFVDINSIKNALGPNGGKSLADKIDSTHRMALDSIKTLSLLDARISDYFNYIERPLFEADPTGLNIRVNVALEHAFGYRAAELSGSGWEQLVIPEHRDRVRREWASAVSERRAYLTRATYVTTAGLHLKVTVRARPRFNVTTGELLGFMGEIEIESAQPTGAAA